MTIRTVAPTLSDLTGKGDRGEDFMRTLATRNHGECRIVAKPPD